MSGQPYRYYNDPTKFRTMFMDTLALRADLDTMNFEANKTYKETGQLPAVSQLKDTRTTDQVLMDFEKLKMDIVKTVATISSPNFGQMVVQTIQNSPLNSDNKFLVFSAQRIVDVVSSIKKLYRYGIKGDENDAQQFVDFISTMYNDKNQLTAQTKSFMNRQGIKSMTLNSSVFSVLYDYLTKLSAHLLQINNIAILQFVWIGGLTEIEDGTQLNNILGETTASLGEIVSFITTLKGAIPRNANEATQIENLLLNQAQAKEYTEKVYEIENYGEEFEVDRSKSILKRGSILPRDFSDNQTAKFQTPVDEFLFRYLDFLNTALPSVGILTSIDNQLMTFWNQANKTFSKIIKDEKDFDNLYNLSDPEQTKLLVESGWVKACIANYSKVNDILINLENALQPSSEWDEANIKLLTKQKNKHNIHELAMYKQTEYRKYGDLPVNTAPSYGTGEDEPSPYPRQQTSSSSSSITQPSSSSSSSSGGETAEETVERLFNEALAESSVKKEGSGIKKRRGRPRGCGIAKPISYKESVKSHTVLDKGIMETPRFLKFGKYLVNNHRLHNEDIFALKRPSGGNIVEIPSIKVSKGLGGVIKKMLGGAIPTYSDISKLSEPEKAYLHKISQKSNILDKFDIPAPAKDNMEKDIHQFEVMRGEIMAGNDSKELLKKFKLHILKLSKSGTLPKREVQEILEDLLELGN